MSQEAVLTAAPPSKPLAGPELLARPTAVIVFLTFALAYFLSALVRAITATLSPTLSVEFSLSASDLGLLAGGYFFGFALTQLPLGSWLDRYGPRRVIVAFLSVAVVGCDGLPFGRYTVPPLTTVQLDQGRLGRTAVKHVLDTERSEEERCSIRLLPCLEQRESTQITKQKNQKQGE